MESPQTIRPFLAAVRRRLRRRAAGYWALLAAAAALAVGLAAPLAVPAAGASWAGPLRWIALGAAAAAAGAAAVLGGLRPGRRWRSDRAVARHVGSQAPEIASDLVSTVELAGRAGTGERASPALVQALADSTARRLARIEPAALVPMSPLRRPAAAATALAAAYAAAAIALPGPLGRGWRALIAPPDPGPLAGADMAPEPLVGDLHLTLAFPDHTGRPDAELPASSGDFRAMPGTRVTVETTALAPTDAARIVFDPPKDAGAPRREPVALDVTGRRLSASFVVMERQKYRFLLERGDERRVEASPHTIEIERDRTPSVELHAPARELDVTDMKRIELAYVAEDDYGIREVALVWESGGETQRKPLPLPDPSRRAESKFLWDLAEVTLEPGSRIAYHVEVRDNDEVEGPKVGKSEEFYLRVYSPRERHEQLVGRQRELFEHMVQNLGDRLVVEPGDVAAHRPIHRDADKIVVELGSVIAAMKEDELASTKLRGELEAMRERLGRLAEDEDELLRALRRSGRGAARRLARSDEARVAELEDDVLVLADWLDRQRLENLLAIGDEVEGHRERVQELLDEYARTGSSEVRAELEREMRALERRLDELRSQQAKMPADVLDQFVNREAMVGDRQKGCMQELRELVEAGKARAAQAKMEECSQELDRTAKALEKSLSELRGGKFSEEQRAFEEVLNELTDLARDQEQLADESEAIWNRYAERAAERMRDQAEKTRSDVTGTLDELRARVEDIPRRGLTPFSQEELEAVKTRLSDIAGRLEDGDIAEALSMARQAEAGLEAMGAELDATLAEGNPWSDRSEEAAEAVKGAQPLARELVEKLKQATPSPEEIMSPSDRRALGRLRRRQRSLRDKAESLARRAGRRAAEMPGTSGKQVAESLGEAGKPMGRAADRMGARDPSGARQEARDAANQLEKAKERARGAARRRQRRSGAAMSDEPVRIPGASEYQAPEKFREELLDAMKEDDPPEGYREMVERYYEELIR